MILWHVIMVTGSQPHTEIMTGTGSTVLRITAGVGGGMGSTAPRPI